MPGESDGGEDAAYAGRDAGGSGDASVPGEAAASETREDAAAVERAVAEALAADEPPPDAVDRIRGEGGGPPSGGVRAVLRTSLITGAAVVVPLLVTVVVLVLVANVVSDIIGPFAVALSWLPVGIADPLVLEVATVLVLLGAMLVVGYFSAYRPGPSRFVGRRLEGLIESLPGIGAVYKSFNQMSRLLVDSDSQSFKEVVLVEYPTEGSYVVAFRTGTPPEVVSAATGHREMVTLFMPMGPNPVLGGFVLHVSADRVHDVGLTVEEGVRSIVTSGVATGRSRRDR